MSSYPNQYPNCFGSYSYTAADSQYVVSQIATDLIELNNRRRNMAYANHIYGVPNMPVMAPNLYGHASHPHSHHHHPHPHLHAAGMPVIYPRNYMNNYNMTHRFAPIPVPIVAHSAPSSDTYEQNGLSSISPDHRVSSRSVAESRLNTQSARSSINNGAERRLSAHIDAPSAELGNCSF